VGNPPADLTRELGQDWEMLNTAMKPYSACKCTHASIQALLELMQEHKFKADEIESVSFDESPINWLTVCDPAAVNGTADSTRMPVQSALRSRYRSPGI